MDTSTIQTQYISHEYGIIIGHADQNISVEYLNVRCPFCKAWFENTLFIWKQAIQQGQITRIIKLLDHPKNALRSGNVMHHFVPFDDPQAALEALTKIFETQNTWGRLHISEVANYAKNELHLTMQDHILDSKKIKEEAELANIKLVPTVVINQTHIFDESITNDELMQLIYQKT